MKKATFKAKIDEVVHLNSVYTFLSIIPLEAYYPIDQNGRLDHLGSWIRFTKNVEIMVSISIT